MPSRTRRRRSATPSDPDRTHESHDLRRRPRRTDASADGRLPEAPAQGARPPAHHLPCDQPGARRHQGHRHQPLPPRPHDRGGTGRRQPLRRAHRLLPRADAAGNRRRHRQRPAPAGRRTLPGACPATSTRPTSTSNRCWTRCRTSTRVGRPIPRGQARHRLAVPDAEPLAQPGRRLRPDHVHAVERRLAEVEFRGHRRLPS